VTQEAYSPAKRVVIVGGGFGGLACAQAFKGTDIDVTVIDRRNHNLFQPLLYQVATAALSPADISEPIRRTLGNQPNIRVMLEEVVGIEQVGKTVGFVSGGHVGYDYLVLATGSVYNYFGHPEWQSLAPGLKSIHEARLIRQRLLLAFEHAETTSDPVRRKELLTTVIIGGGPTGVEMAGAVSELGSYMIERDFRSLKFNDMRVVLVEAGPRLLAAFPDDLARYAQDHLERIGVTVLLGKRVTDIREGCVEIGTQELPCGCVVWGAGIKPSPAAEWLGSGSGSKIAIDGFLRVKGADDVFALGDTAEVEDGSGSPLPALAQVAKQQGTYLGRLLVSEIKREPRPGPFRFRNRGNTAVVGRHAAVFDFGRWHLKGWIAWLLWALVHVYLLVNFEKRVLVSVQWAWRYVTKQRGARLIDEDAFNPSFDIDSEGSADDRPGP
jgi:NADH dehydrogenase